MKKIKDKTNELQRVLEKRVRCQLITCFWVLPSELLYSDDLVLYYLEQLGRCVAEWRAILLDKGLKVNAGKSK